MAPTLSSAQLQARRVMSPADRRLASTANKAAPATSLKQRQGKGGGKVR